MAAQLLPLDEVLEQEFLLIAEREGCSVTGTELTLAAALRSARFLAAGGYRVTVESCDPFLEDHIRYTVEVRP